MPKGRVSFLTVWEKERVSEQGQRKEGSRHSLSPFCSTLTGDLWPVYGTLIEFQYAHHWKPSIQVSCTYCWLPFNLSSAQAIVMALFDSLRNSLSSRVPALSPSRSLSRSLSLWQPLERVSRSGSLNPKPNFSRLTGLASWIAISRDMIWIAVQVYVPVHLLANRLNVSILSPSSLSLFLSQLSLTPFSIVS